MKKLELIFIALTIGCSAYAQTIIKGSIFDEKGEALTGANIYIENTYDGASSDINGLFQFKTQAEGLHKLRVEFIGYKPVSTEVNLNGGVVEKTYRMEEAFNQLEAVVITAGSFEAGDKKRAIEMTSLDIATTAGAMGDIVGALNTLPGTTRVGESGRLYVRGGSDEETKTFIDGMLVGAPYFSSAPNLATRGRFNPFLFSGTVFNTGGYSAEYGQALSSVLLLSTTEEKVKDELNLSLLAGLGGDVTATKSWNEGSITASASYFNMRPYLALVSNNQEWTKPMEMVLQEISLKQRSGKHGMFKWYSNYNSGRFGLEQSDLDNPDERIRFQQQTRTHFFNASWNTTLNEKWYVFSGVSSTLNRDAMTINDDPFGEQVRNTHIKAGADHQFSEKVSIRFGADYFDQSYINTFSDDVTPSELRMSNDLAAVYAEANMYASTRFVVRAGARAEYAAALDEYTVAPRFSSAFKLDDNSQVSWAYGWFYQLPTNRDLMQSQRLNVERADHVLLSYQRNKNNRMLRGEVYYKRYDDLVSYDGVMPFERTNYSNDGYGYAYGLDVFFRDAKTIKNGHYWISYSYLETERDYQAFPVMTTPTFASKHNLSIVYKHWLSRWRSMLSADFSYASPRPYHDPNTQGFNSARMKSFSSLNASWVYLFKNQVIFYASCSNLLGRKNEFGYRFSNTPNDDGLYAKEVIAPFSQRFYVLGIFFTFSKDKTRNQLDKIN